jgi:hypothetical protein
MPLGSTATHEPIEIPRSLWGRWKSPDATGLKPLWIKKQSNTNKLIPMTTNDHRRTSSNKHWTKRSHLKGELGGVGSRGPCGVDEANDPTPMSNSADRNTSIQRHKQILLAGKR